MTGPFSRTCADLGYADGRNLTIDFLFADGRFERFPALAVDCVRLKADVIVALTTPGALAAKKATSTIPIVSVVLLEPWQCERDVPAV